MYCRRILAFDVGVKSPLPADLLDQLLRSRPVQDEQLDRCPIVNGSLFCYQDRVMNNSYGEYRNYGVRRRGE